MVAFIFFQFAQVTAQLTITQQLVMGHTQANAQLIMAQHAADHCATGYDWPLIQRNLNTSLAKKFCFRFGRYMCVYVKEISHAEK